MLLFNANDFPVEFRHGGVLYLFKSKESKDLPEEVVNHALDRAKAPLVKQTPMYDSQVEFTDVNYNEMPWKKLLSLASARGIFSFGMDREATLKALEEYDNTTTGTLSQPSN